MTGDRYQVAGDRYRGSAIKVPVTNLLRLLAQGPKFSKYFPAVIHRHLLDTRTFLLLPFSKFPAPDFNVIMHTASHSITHDHGNSTSSTRLQPQYTHGLTLHHTRPWEHNFQHQISVPLHTHTALHPRTHAMLKQYGNFPNLNLQ